MPPIKISRYEIKQELGRGAMGQVYLAYDPNIGRKLAIKTIPLDEGDPEQAWRFRREAQAAGVLSHPNVVTIFDAGADEGSLFIAMELVEGETLQKILSRGRMPVEEAIPFIEQIAAGLDHAHSHSIVHRDIKPANIMVQAGRVKIMDFGVARVAAHGLTSTGHLLSFPGGCEGREGWPALGPVFSRRHPV